MLPWHGTLLEQPEFVIQVFEICEATSADVQSAKDRVQQAELDKVK